MPLSNSFSTEMDFPSPNQAATPLNKAISELLLPMVDPPAWLTKCKDSLHLL